MSSISFIVQHISLLAQHYHSTSYLQTHAHQSDMLVGTYGKYLVRALLEGAWIATMRMVWGSGSVPGPITSASTSHLWGESIL